ncbi:MAG: tetratricopeptide repeat-containing sensor histidine kinase [Bacteroidales bacterium]
MSIITKTKFVFTFYLIFFYGNTLFSQFKNTENKLNDSIITYIKGTNDFTLLIPDSVILYTNFCKILHDKRNVNKNKAEMYQKIAKEYADKQQYKLALANYNISAYWYEKIKNQDELSNVYNSVGIIYGKIYSYDKALFYLHKTISILVKEGNNKKISASLNNLGIIYRGLKNYNKAQSIFQQSLFFARKSGNDISIASSLNNISQNYFLTEKYPEALKYQLEAIKIYENKNNKKRLSSCYISLGSIYQKQNNKTAIVYFNKAKKLAIELNDNYLVSFVNNSIASVYISLKNYPLSFKYLSESEEIANKIQDWVCMKSSYELFTTYYEQTGDCINALKYQRKSKDINDSIFNKESSDRFLDLQVKYEVEEKDNENKILKQESTIQQLAIQKQIYIRNIFIAVSIIISMFVFIILFRFYLKKKANKILSQKNHEISRQKDELEELYSPKDKLFAIITHDLKNPFGTIISLAGYLEESYTDIDDNQKSYIIKTIKKSADTAYDLMENLTKWLLSQDKNIAVHTTTFDIYDAILSILADYKIEIEKKKIKIDFTINNPIFVLADEQMIKTIIRNLLFNAIKFTLENGKIIVKVMNLENEIHVSIKDNGIGIKEEDKAKIFKIESNFSTIGTAKEKGSGLGLILSKEFAERNNCKIWFESEALTLNSDKINGSTFYLSILKVKENE